MTASYKTRIEGSVLETAITSVGGFHMSYILAEEVIDDELGCGRRAFSVFVAMCGDHGERGAVLVRDITDSYELAAEFFTLISEGAVMPCSLPEVAEDFVASV